MLQHLLLDNNIIKRRWLLVENGRSAHTVEEEKAFLLLFCFCCCCYCYYYITAYYIIIVDRVTIISPVHLCTGNTIAPWCAPSAATADRSDTTIAREDVSSMSGLQQQQQEQHQQVNIKMEPTGPSSPTPAAVNSNLVVRVDQNSETDLQALFDTVLKPDGKKPLQLPLRMRQLPKSFFNPPSTGSKSPSISHSRENSGDSAFGPTAAGQSCPVPMHSRAHSSPASLQQTYAVGVAKQQQQQQQHAKQRSYDVSSAIDELGPLPQGWEQARTPEGQIYYLKWVPFFRVAVTPTHNGRLAPVSPRPSGRDPVAVTVPV